VRAMKVKVGTSVAEGTDARTRASATDLRWSVYVRTRKMVFQRREWNRSQPENRQRNSLQATEDGRKRESFCNMQPRRPSSRSSRKVGTSQGKVVEDDPGKPAGKCHRNKPPTPAVPRERPVGKGEMVR